MTREISTPIRRYFDELLNGADAGLALAEAAVDPRSTGAPA
jgi:hypothetical protein